MAKCGFDGLLSNPRSCQIQLFASIKYLSMLCQMLGTLKKETKSVFNALVSHKAFQFYRKVNNTCYINSMLLNIPIY